MIKPEAVAQGDTGHILGMITDAGFRIVGLKKVQLTHKQAGEFYAIHKDRSFFEELITYMSNGPIVAAILEKSNAVSDYRTLIGATDPANAIQGTIRKRFAKSISENAIHGSDSDENATLESNFFFSTCERF